MRTRINFIKRRIPANLASGGTPVLVQWRVYPGAMTLDPVTKAPATAAGVLVQPQPMSGILQAFGQVEPPRNVERAFTEIQTGDLILDLASNPMVTVFNGQLYQSGLVPLESLDGARLNWGGVWYEQAKLGDELLAAWDATFAGQTLHKTILLKRAT